MLLKYLENNFFYEFTIVEVIATTNLHLAMVVTSAGGHNLLGLFP